jgi:hypothetical protein
MQEQHLTYQIINNRTVGTLTVNTNQQKWSGNQLSDTAVIYIMHKHLKPNWTIHFYNFCYYSLFVAVHKWTMQHNNELQNVTSTESLH